MKNIITREQKYALKQYITQFGRFWKVKLFEDWSVSQSPQFKGEYFYLQQLRNQQGPEWLYRLTTKKALEL